MKFKLTPAAAQALRTYAAMSDKERGRLARVRRYNARTKAVRWHGYRTERADIEAATNETAGPWRALWGEDWYAATCRFYLTVARITLARPKLTEFQRKWVPYPTTELQAADLEAQSVIGALILRDHGVISDESFAVFTAAWTKLGLPIPSASKVAA